MLGVDPVWRVVTQADPLSGGYRVAGLSEIPNDLQEPVGRRRAGRRAVVAVRGEFERFGELGVASGSVHASFMPEAEPRRSMDGFRGGCGKVRTEQSKERSAVGVASLASGFAPCLGDATDQPSAPRGLAY